MVYNVPKESINDTPTYYSTTAASTPAAASAPVSTPTPSNLTSIQQNALNGVNYYNNLDPNSTVQDPSFYGGDTVDGYPSWVWSDPTLQGLGQSVSNGNATMDQVYARANAVLAGGQSNVAQNNLTQLQGMANSGYQYSLAHPDQQDGIMDTIMGKVLPAVVGGFMGFGALGALAGTGGAAVSAGAGSAGDLLDSSALGSMSTNPAALGDTSWMSGITSSAAPSAATAAGATGAAGAAATGLGSDAASAAIPTVNVTAPAAGALPASTAGAAASAAGLVTADQLGNMSTSNSSTSAMPSISGVTVPDSSLPGLTVPPLVDPSSISNSDVTGSSTPTSAAPGISIPGLSSGSSSGSTTPGLGSILGGIGTIGSAISDYTMNSADQSYYQGLVNQLTGMYNPGTPEATQMANQMNAKDAAAGRNSQYGVRSVNLAADLAQQRANIMTSNGFTTLAQDARGHYDNSLNSLFGALGQASNSSTNLGSLVNSATPYLQGLTNSVSNGVSTAINSGTSALSNLFGGGS